VFRRTKTDLVKEQVELANRLAKDSKFRKELLKAIRHGTIARRRAAPRRGIVAVSTRAFYRDDVRRELRKMLQNLDEVWARVQKKQKPSHKLRNTMIVVGAGGAVAAIPHTRRFILARVSSAPSLNRGMPRTIEESIDVNVPVSTAYNQWTQFEDFPLFMEGVDHVQQLDDTRLHWAATVAGKTNEWDAKILEQHPDRQISWISEDGKKTRGTVTFEPRGADKTNIRLSMSYQADPLEAVGSVAGLDAKRIRGDLQRFKELIESEGRESGAWRGEVSAGSTKD
jgi:uncharacterized membrane protein